MTISRNRFNKWLQSYSEFKYDCKGNEGRDQLGRWIRFVSKAQYESQFTDQA